MGSIPRDYDEQCRFDAFCKAVLRNEARNLQQSMRRQRRRVTPLDTVSPTEWDKLSVTDSYPSDSFVFSSHGYSMCIDNELVAAAFAGLSATEQSILILRCALDMTDSEIGAYLEMSRSAVQRRRTKALTGLRAKLAALMPKGG
ncbi:MAG: sigma-70 family RNA polymerase sigma factor [Lachnospiraceae bacterium]|jgi:RNA polymerase sigma factor (sigma-70 family)|nr:sigma-70 family RNA polymerase sigma factor [Lachnospiraceae bacterium]